MANVCALSARKCISPCLPKKWVTQAPRMIIPRAMCNTAVNAARQNGCLFPECSEAPRLDCINESNDCISVFFVQIIELLRRVVRIRLFAVTMPHNSLNHIASITLRARVSCIRASYWSPVAFLCRPRPQSGVVRHHPVRISFSMHSLCCTMSVYGQIFWFG